MGVVRESHRFEEFLGRIDRAGDCWVWTGARKNGYGVIRINGNSTYTHRFMWSVANREEIPEGMFVCHKCDNPICVRPTHLFIGTPAENIADMDAKGRRKNAPSPGELNGSTSLTDDDVRQIIALYETGDWTQEELANRFGTHQTSVSKMVRGERWTHLHGEKSEVRR